MFRPSVPPSCAVPNTRRRWGRCTSVQPRIRPVLDQVVDFRRERQIETERETETEAGTHRERERETETERQRDT